FVSAVTGDYLEGPWEFHVQIEFEDNQLYYVTLDTAERWELIPINESEFADVVGSIYRFPENPTEEIDQFDLWLSPIFPPGGQWYKGIRISE
ncbi:MAG: hypothetical protein AAF633_19035, partial [Chloroflexota bacterium]